MPLSMNVRLGGYVGLIQNTLNETVFLVGGVSKLSSKITNLVLELK